jgi:hypothetical protein
LVDKRDAESVARRVLAAGGLTGTIDVSGNRVVVTVTVSSPALVGVVPVNGFWSSEISRQSTTSDGP